jgi:hypothetical protein
MVRPLGRWICPFFLLLSLGACQRSGERLVPTPLSPTAMPSRAIATVPAAPLPTATPISTRGRPAASPRLPTMTPAPSQPPTPAYGWRYWPNTTDLRDVAVDGDRLWIAALSGLVLYEPSSGRWQVWTTVDGLIDNTCESVVAWQDQVWVGTQGGISRYDPATDAWRSYTTRQGLPGLHNIRLYLDPYARTLWAGTFEGLASYDGRIDRWIEQAAAGTELKGVAHFWANPDHLWVSASAGAPGIWQLDRDKGAWTDVHRGEALPLAGDYALAGNEDYLWAVSVEGTPYELDLATGVWRRMDEIWTPSRSGYGWPRYQGSTLWLWDQKTWLRYDPRTRESLRLPAPMDASLAPQGDLSFAPDVAWLPTRSGLYALDLGTGKWTPHARLDLPGTIASAQRAGDGLFDPIAGTWKLIPAPPDRGQLRQPTIALQADGSQMWVLSPSLGLTTPGTIAPELWEYGRTGEQFEIQGSAIPIPPDLHLGYLLPLVDEGRLWFAGRDGLAARRLQDGAWETYPLQSAAGYLTGAAQEPGAIWLLSGGETLVRFDTRQRAVEMQTIPFGRNWDAIALSPETVWLGGDSTVLLGAKRATKRWTELELDGGCVGSTLLALAAGDRILWASGESGVAGYDLQTGQQACYQAEDGMMADDPAQIIPDGEAVWFVHPWRGLWGRYPANSRE